jgi:hypothetical protein
MRGFVGTPGPGGKACGSKAGCTASAARSCRERATEASGLEGHPRAGALPRSRAMLAMRSEGERDEVSGPHRRWHERRQGKCRVRGSWEQAPGRLRRSNALVSAAGKGNEPSVPGEIWPNKEANDNNGDHRCSDAGGSRYEAGRSAMTSLARRACPSVQNFAQASMSRRRFSNRSPRR